MIPPIVCFVSTLLGMLIGAFAMGYYKDMKSDAALETAVNASDGRWRVSMSKLVAYLLGLGYETRIDNDVFQVDAPGERFLISMPIRRFDPTALMESLADLPPAREWLDHREGAEDDYEDPPVEPNPPVEPPAPTETSTAAPPAPPATSSDPA